MTEVQPIQISEKAIAQIAKIQKNENKSELFLRVSVVGGGCSGLSYKLDFTNDKKEKDIQMSHGDVAVLLDPKSLLFVKGMTLDFSDGLNGKGFEFINPNAKQTCGCGSSFSA